MKQRAMQKALAHKQAEINKIKQEAEQKLAYALSIPQIAAAHEKYVNLRFQNAICGDVDNLEAENALKSYQEALKENNLTENDFIYTAACPICHDTGNVNGAVCKCVWKDYISALKQECRIDEKAPFSFEECELKIVKDEKQRALLERLYRWMYAYSQKLPENVRSKITVFSGGVGTGKTCIASAVARNAVARGKSCKFMTAFEFNNEMLAAHVSPMQEKTDHLHDVLTADLLVIDDLGTEPFLRNVTEEYLLLVLEERQNAGLCTIITTNLDEEKILARYHERVYSRIAHKKYARFFVIEGDDLRLYRLGSF